jgi:hypothetical protein
VFLKCFQIPVFQPQFDILCNKKTKNVCWKGNAIFKDLGIDIKGVYVVEVFAAVVMQVTLFWLVACSLTCCCRC